MNIERLINILNENKSVNLYDLLTTKNLNKFCEERGIRIEWAIEKISDFMKSSESKKSYWQSILRNRK